MSHGEEEKQIIPDVITDSINKRIYKKGRFFGKGGFAKCYEIIDLKSNEIYAGKIVSKSIMAKHNQREKMSQEIAIHRSLSHKHVVGFHGFFEDASNVYIVLELCRRRSMMELHKRRKALTEPEVRYYMSHILLGVMYLHQKKIIHRDLKLGNLFLNDDLEVKIGDFGLAAKVEFDGERKKTLCGTPNYIAPEILMKKGHSYEVDIWSTGCILYTLLVGKPPFETTNLKDTYSRIKRCEYRIPTTVKISKGAHRLINSMLQSDPKSRPSVQQCLNHEFFQGYIPPQLPVSCLTMAPRFDILEKVATAKTKDISTSRRPLYEMNTNGFGDGSPVPAVARSPKRAPPSNSRYSVAMASGMLPSDSAPGVRTHLVNLYEQLKEVLRTKPGDRAKPLTDDMYDPAAQPIVWIAKWVDYSDKYGFGYQLSDEGMGVMFNDTTKLILLADGKNVHYIGRDSKENYYTMTKFPGDIDKKMKLLSYFHRYMTEHLVKTGDGAGVRECDSLSRMPYLSQWFRTSTAVVMLLTNGTLQINFTDHTKLIMCPLMAAVTYIDNDKSLKTFRFKSIEENGCSKELERGLQYAAEKVKSMIV